MFREDQFVLEALEGRVLMDGNPAAVASAELPQAALSEAIVAGPEAPGQMGEAAEHPESHQATEQPLQTIFGDLAGLEDVTAPSEADPELEVFAQTTVDPSQLKALDAAPERPLLLVHGIGGSMPYPDHYDDWLMNRGFAPNNLDLD